ncbi:unnamed protein product, partial [Oppiella nova]
MSPSKYENLTDTLRVVTCLTSSVLTLSAISCDRFVAIFFPLRARVTKQRTGLVIAIIWIVSLVVSIPFLIYRKHHTFERGFASLRCINIRKAYEGKGMWKDYGINTVWRDYIETNCVESWPSISEYSADTGICIKSYVSKKIYYTFVSTTLFFIPVLVMVTAYSLIVWRLWYNEIPGERSQNNVSQHRKAKKKFMSKLFAHKKATVPFGMLTVIDRHLLTAFVISWMPLQIIVLYSLFGHSANASGEGMPVVEYDELTNHKNSVHLNVRYVCDWSECGKQFTTKRSLNRHKNKIHLSINSRKFNCSWPKCQFKSSNGQSLIQHQLTHSSVKQIICNNINCNEMFTTVKQLYEHKNSVHLNVRYVCDWSECGKQFTNKFDLKRQKSCVHLNEKLFKCNEENCGKSFGVQSHLTKHKRTVHSHEKPFVCHFNDCYKICQALTVRVLLGMPVVARTGMVKGIAKLLPKWFPSVSYFATFIAYSNSVFNPIIYGGFNKNFRQALCSIFRCQDKFAIIHRN